MRAPELPPPRRSWWSWLLIGMVAANVVTAGFCFGIAKIVEFSGKEVGKTLAIPSMFLVPVLSGLVAAWCWRKLNLGIGQSALYSLLTSLLGLGGASVLFHEGIVCLVMVAPLYYGLIFTGAAVGRLLFRPDWTKLQVSVIPLLALSAAAEPFARSDTRAVVTDEIRIDAPPSRVWPHVLAFPEITEPPRHWIFRLGLPAPLKTTSSGNFVGAARQCIFSDGIVIHERVAEFEPEQKLTFDVTEQPTHPEAYGHITLHRGQFLLRDNHDGTTTLIGSSWYTLHVRPLWYFDLWTRNMTRAVHLRVMEHIRRLAEELHEGLPLAVRRLPWLARVPGFPQIFDSALLLWTALFDRQCLAAIEAIERAALRMSGVRLVVHRRGGIGFKFEQREFAHLHGNGLLDAQVGRARSAELIAAGIGSPHHALPDSGWISFQVRASADEEVAIGLLQEALDRSNRRMQSRRIGTPA